MKTFTGIALALLVGAGVGYGAFTYMTPKADVSVTPATESAQAIAVETANIEPAAAPAEEKQHGADDPVVAKVDGKPVYKSEVMDFVKTLPPQMSQADPKTIFPMALDQVISAKIVDEKAITEKTENDPVVQKRLADAKLQIVRAVYAEKSIEKEFSQDAVKKAYDDIVKNIPKTEEVHARHILVDTETEAKDIIKKLDGGAKFEDLAKELSKDKSNSATGGDLGFFAKNDMVKEFSEAAFALKANEYTKTPVKTQFGFHVIQSLEKRERPAPKFEDVKLQVEGQVRRDILNKLVEKWRSEAKIEAFDMDGKPIPAASSEPAKTDAAPAESKPADTKSEDKAADKSAEPADKPAEEKKAE